MIDKNLKNLFFLLWIFFYIWFKNDAVHLLIILQSIENNKLNKK